MKKKKNKNCIETEPELKKPGYKEERYKVQKEERTFADELIESYVDYGGSVDLKTAKPKDLFLHSTNLDDDIRSAAKKAIAEKGLEGQKAKYIHHVMSGHYYNWARHDRSTEDYDEDEKLYKSLGEPMIATALKGERLGEKHAKLDKDPKARAADEKRRQAAAYRKGVQKGAKAAISTVAAAIAQAPAKEEPKDPKQQLASLDRSSPRFSKTPSGADSLVAHMSKVAGERQQRDSLAQAHAHAKAIEDGKRHVERTKFENHVQGAVKELHQNLNAGNYDHLINNPHQESFEKHFHDNLDSYYGPHIAQINDIMPPSNARAEANRFLDKHPHIIKLLSNEYREHSGQSASINNSVIHQEAHRKMHAYYEADHHQREMRALEKEHPVKKIIRKLGFNLGPPKIQESVEEPQPLMEYYAHVIYRRPGLKGRTLSKYHIESIKLDVDKKKFSPEWIKEQVKAHKDYPKGFYALHFVGSTNSSQAKAAELMNEFKTIAHTVEKQHMTKEAMSKIVEEVSDESLNEASSMKKIRRAVSGLMGGGENAIQPGDSAGMKRRMIRKYGSANRKSTKQYDPKNPESNEFGWVDKKRF